MNRKSFKELEVLLKKEIEGNRQFIESLENSKNLQVQERVSFARGEIDALEKVLEYASKGSKIFFDYK